jgi:hypothetical protein
LPDTLTAAGRYGTVAYVKQHKVVVAFVAKSGVRIERTYPLRDVTRANAEYRAKRLVPAGSTNVEVAR